jgi:3-oxoacyl-[acyl-carrier protein] reductase
MNLQLLKDKVAIVTGASRGIGFEISRQLAERGAAVIMCSRSLETLQKSASLIRGKTYVERLDLTDTQGMLDFVPRMVEKHKHIDILINNAGYPFDRAIWNKRFHEIADEDLERVIEVDVKGTFKLSQAIISFMIKNNNNNNNNNNSRGVGGVIINISSTPAIAGHTAGAPYSIAKAGVIAMTKHIALEYGDRNIRAYTLALGNIATDATYDSMTILERKKAAMENSMKRWGHPREVATIAASLASDDFLFATGNTIIIDGGTVLI